MKDSGDNFIHPTALVAPNVKIGTGNYIGPYCMIGYPAEHKAFWGKDQKGVEIGDDNVFTGHVTIDAGTERPTTIGNGIWMLKHSHVGHDAVIGDKATISCGAKVGGHAIIGPGTNIGLNACIHQWVDVPEGCMIGMNAAVTKKLALEPFRKYAGVPAKDIGTNQKGEIVGMSTNRAEIRKKALEELSKLGQEEQNMYLVSKIKENPTFQILGDSGGKTIFVLKGIKNSPVMIYVPAEGKIYTSGLGLFCNNEDSLVGIFILLGYNI